MRENKNLEYKESITSNAFMKTISAYANYGGGKIVFGITDDGNVKGIEDATSACLDLENKINDSMKPVPEYTLEIQNDSTILLTVFEGLYKPYLYKGKAYKRSDSATIEVDRLEYGRLILEGRNQSFEEMTSFKQDLSFSELEQKLIQIMGIDKLDINILKTLELYSDKNGFNHAAELLADQNGFKGVDIVRFGETIDEIMDREFYENVSILTQLEQSVRMFQKYYQYEKIEKTERTVIDKIPEKAFREAIANALVHRTWDVNASIKVSMYADRIEICSPGGLPAGMNEDEYLHGQISILRNPIIGNIFFRLKYIEKFGTGIMRINRSYADMLEKPSYKIFENSIKVVLPVISLENSLNETERQIVDLLKKERVMTRPEITSMMGLSKDKTIRVLNSLLEKRIIGKSGAGRGTRYNSL